MSTHTELERLYQRDGFLDGDQVVKAARSAAKWPDLHDYLYVQTTDKQAAHQHRVRMAEDLIRRVKITIETQPERTIRIRKFVAVRNDDGTSAGYQATLDAMRNPATRERVLAQARRDIAALRRKYDTLLELADLIDLMTEAA